jgi:hypothetical protein
VSSTNPNCYSSRIKLRGYINVYSANSQPIRLKYSDRPILSNELSAAGHDGITSPYK